MTHFSAFLLKTSLRFCSNGKIIFSIDVELNFTSISIIRIDIGSETESRNPQNANRPESPRISEFNSIWVAERKSYSLKRP